MCSPNTSSRIQRIGLAALVSVCFNAAAAQESEVQESQSPPDIMLILDASGSMWGQIGDDYKIAAARTVLKDLAAKVPSDSEIGLIAYGHRNKGDCNDIETLLPMGVVNLAAVSSAVDELNPTGMTPITASIRTAFDAIRDLPTRQRSSSSPTDSKRAVATHVKS